MRGQLAVIFHLGKDVTSNVRNAAPSVKQFSEGWVINDLMCQQFLCRVAGDEEQGSHSVCSPARTSVKQSDILKDLK